jgi:RNA polymerase sigma factor (sigma-70 family)
MPETGSTEAFGGPVNDVAATNGGSTLVAQHPVVVMDLTRASTIDPEDAAALLRSFVQGERARALRVQLAAQHPESSDEEVEDAVQYACKSFLDEAQGMTDPGQVYTWIRTAAHRALNRMAQRREREPTVDLLRGSFDESVSEEPTPEEELIAREDKGEIATLVREVIGDLPQRDRQVLALHVAGLTRPEIASRLGLTERAVKRDLMEGMDKARAAIASKAGGGCLWREPLVARFAYGLATPAESVQARLHIKSCHRCEMLWEQLDAWREKAAVLLPASPAIEQASPGLLERVAHRAADGLSSVKQQVLGGAAQAKQQVAATYYRAVDPTPLAAARPGTVAAVLASCITIGGGAATYCANQGVDPIGAATGLIAGTQEPEPKQSPPPPETTEATPVVPALPPVSEEPGTTEATPPPAEAEDKSQAEPPPPPPEQTFEPSSPNYPATESSAEYQAPESASAESARPAPVPAGEAPQFGGP